MSPIICFRYIGKQIGRLLVKSGTIVCLERTDSSSFHEDSMYQWSGRKPSTPNLRNGSPSKIGQSWKMASPSSESPSSVRSGAKYTEAEMQQALVRMLRGKSVRACWGSVTCLIKLMDYKCVTHDIKLSTSYLLFWS